MSIFGKVKIEGDQEDQLVNKLEEKMGENAALKLQLQKMEEKLAEFKAKLTAEAEAKAEAEATAEAEAKKAEELEAKKQAQAKELEEKNAELAKAGTQPAANAAQGAQDVPMGNPGEQNKYVSIEAARKVLEAQSTLWG